MNRTTGLIIRTVIMILAAASCLLLCSCDPILPLNQKYAYSSFELELGEPISPDIGEYVDLSRLSAEDAEFVRQNTQILYDGRDIAETDTAVPGGHILTINYKGHQYRQYTIEITDRMPPVFTKVRNLYTFPGIPISEEEYDTIFEATDNSGQADVDVDMPEIDYNTAGEYKVTATATDSSGNRSTAEASIVVQEPSYGSMGTYVFVSISDQHLTYFVDGKVAMDCPVVTGNIHGHSTPKGTFKVNYKARNIVLKGTEDNGDEYQSFVNYWMAFIGSSYGLHDATWRSRFGEEIYQYGGSHGCVNMPYASAAKLYEMIEPGTPVLIY